jgi:CelD/BcsL family acetyltransferase involved in cellulose biosynthesis
VRPVDRAAGTSPPASQAGLSSLATSPLALDKAGYGNPQRRAPAGVIATGLPYVPAAEVIFQPAVLTELGGLPSGALPTQHASWLNAAAATLVGAQRLVAVVVRDGAGAVRGLAPLERRHGHLELLGVPALYEPCDLLAADDVALEALARRLARLRRAVHLRRLPAGSPTESAIRRAFRHRGVVIRRPAAGCPRIELGDRGLEPESLLTARRRSDLRRARRRAEALGDVVSEIHIPDPAQVGPLMQEALAVEAAGWKAAAGTALVHDPVRRAFFERYATAIAAEGALRIAFLRIGGDTAAMQLAVVHADALWLLKIGYDERFARCSPGTLLTAATIAHAAHSGLQSYEFLGTSAPWTRVWTTAERPCATLIAHPLGATSTIALASYAAGALVSSRSRR